MNQQKFTGIIILMAFSLIGIILVQLFWMHKAITIKEEQFDQLANQALTRASHRIERNQNAFFMSHFLGTQSADKSWNAMQNNRNLDSSIAEFRSFWQNNSKHLIKGDETNVKVSTKNSNGIETIEYSFDTVIGDGRSSQRIQTYSQFSKPSFENNEVARNQPPHNASTSDNPFEQQLNQVMDQMVLEFSIRNLTMEERLGSSIIVPTLDFELKNFNIPLSYEYAITDYLGNYYETLKTKGFVKNKAAKAYTTTLFPSDILMPSDKLVLYFPDKQDYLRKSLLMPFSGSLMFTLIILFTFYFTLKTIYNQKKVSEIKTDFINNMTHEFKTPIATISLAADAIRNPNTLMHPEQVSHFTEIIKEENRRMNRQVESVLKMALIDKKDFNLSLTETSVHVLIEQVVRNIKLQVEQRIGTLETDLKATNDLLRIDETHFVNVVYNLLDNAIKYSLNAPPLIQLATYNDDIYFYLQVTDHGIGMDKDTLEKIFEKFYRVPTGDVHTVKGFGLGLSYVKAIVMQFKGDITVTSRKDYGSVFTVKIPLINFNNKL